MKKPYLERPAPWLIAHRGGARLAPENTLGAFDLAASLGADAIETDVRLTRDGAVVVFHDESTLRLTGAPGTIEARTLDEVRALDAGWSWTPEQPDPKSKGAFPWRGRGLSPPLLAEAFDRFPGMRFNIEAKGSEPALAEALVRVVRQKGRVPTVCVGAADDVQAERLRALLPEGCHFLPEQAATCHVLASRTGGSGCPEGYDLADLPLRVGELTVVDALTVGYFHARAMPVHVWTVDAEEEMRALLALGVDGIMSDRPDLLARVLGR